MSGKHKGWAKAWRVEGNRLIHASGLTFVRLDGVVRLVPESLDEFEKHELERGVPKNDLDSRCLRLTREAGDVRFNA
jgi:hypothetical protein